MEFQFTIISDDSELIGRLLEMPGQFEDFNCIGYTGNEEKACDNILSFRPQIVFIDLDNERLSDPFAFVNQLYQYIDELPRFVAISRNKNHAYKALKNNFFDYLLKPLLSSELRKTVMSFKKKHNTRGQLCLKSYSDYQFLNLSDIVFLRADNNATDFHLASGKKVVGYKSMKIYENLLPSTFMRVHKSFIINRNLIKRISFSKNRISLEYQGGLKEIPFSKSYSEEISKLRYSMMQDNLSVIDV
jgi:DNA-binding LytR/AlgR family response regulator